MNSSKKQRTTPFCKIAPLHGQGPDERLGRVCSHLARERVPSFDNLLVRIHSIIVIIRWPRAKGVRINLSKQPYIYLPGKVWIGSIDFVDPLGGVRASRSPSIPGCCVTKFEPNEARSHLARLGCKNNCLAER